MDSDLYTFVAHRDLAYANPLGSSAMERALEVLDLMPGTPVADFGCGLGEFAIRCVEKYSAHVSAVELSTRMTNAARERARVRLAPLGREAMLSIHEADAGLFRASIAPGTFGLCACIGSTHALGGFTHALDVLARLTRPGGLILVGEGFWESDPPADYLAGTGIPPDEYASHAANHQAGEERGMSSLWSISATRREWDEYEWAHARAIERYAARLPHDEAARAMLARSRGWRGMYLQWGRNVLGFGLYLFRREGA